MGVITVPEGNLIVGSFLSYLRVIRIYEVATITVDIDLLVEVRNISVSSVMELVHGYLLLNIIEV